LQAITGDIAPADKVQAEDKSQRERSAMATIVTALRGFCETGADQVEVLVHEYESRESPESKAVKDLDLLEMVVQAEEYEQSTGLDLGDFFRSTEGRFKTVQVKAIAAELIARRESRHKSPVL
jgi:putative hydrolase of HD superfamily